MAQKRGIWLSGATGRMGGELQKQIELSEGWALIGGVAKEASGKILSKWPETAPAGVDVVVDFSLPEAFDEALKWCVRERRPLVSGTTGLSAQQSQKLEEASRTIPVLWASNMSLGIAVLTEMMRLLSYLPEFDFQIEEIHHNRKKDRPSGTAITLQSALRAAVQKEVPEPLSIRGGGVFGVHKVFALSDQEVITLEHTALNRQVFAQGALFAAKWLISQKPGKYQIQDALGLDRHL